MSTRSAPEFALSFSSDAVHLMERAGAPAGASVRWREKAVAPFDAPDFRAEMAILHNLVANGPDARVALIIPDDQILYTSLPIPGRSRKSPDLGRALDGLTPYPVADLAWDWRPEDGGEVRVAAVARQTLREAEDFARRHGFAADSFLADPADGLFPATPQFSDAAWTDEPLGAADLPGDAPAEDAETMDGVSKAEASPDAGRPAPESRVPAAAEEGAEAAALAPIAGTAEDDGARADGASQSSALATGILDDAGATAPAPDIGEETTGDALTQAAAAALSDEVTTPANDAAAEGGSEAVLPVPDAAGSADDANVLAQGTGGTTAEGASASPLSAAAERSEPEEAAGTAEPEIAATADVTAAPATDDAAQGSADDGASAHPAVSTPAVTDAAGDSTGSARSDGMTGDYGPASGEARQPDPAGEAAAPRPDASAQAAGHAVPDAPGSNPVGERAQPVARPVTAAPLDRSRSVPERSAAAPSIRAEPAARPTRHPGARGGVGGLLVMLGALLLGLVLIWAFVTPGPNATGESPRAATNPPDPAPEAAAVQAGNAVQAPAAEAAVGVPVQRSAAAPAAAEATAPTTDAPAATATADAASAEAEAAPVQPAAEPARPSATSQGAAPASPAGQNTSAAVGTAPPTSAASQPATETVPTIAPVTSPEPARAVPAETSSNAPASPVPAQAVTSGQAAPETAVPGRAEPAAPATPVRPADEAVPASGDAGRAPSDSDIPAPAVSAAATDAPAPAEGAPASSQPAPGAGPVTSPVTSSGTDAEPAASATTTGPAPAAQPAAPPPAAGRPSLAPRRSGPAAAPSAAQADPLPAVVPGRRALTRSERPANRPAAARAQPAAPAAAPAATAARTGAPESRASAAPASPPSRPPAAPRASARPAATSAAPVSTARPQPRPEEGSADESMTAAEMTPAERVAADELLAELYAANPWLMPLTAAPTVEGVRFAEARPSRRPGGSASAVDAALAEAVAGTPARATPGDRPAARGGAKPKAATAPAPVKAAANSNGRPASRPSRGGGAGASSAAVESALAEAISTAKPAPVALAAAASLAPVRKPARSSANPQAGAVAAPSIAPPAQVAAAVPDDTAQRLRDEQLQRQAEERARQNAAADARAEQQARAAAEARARAQAEAEERAAIAARGSYRPPENDEEPEIAQKPAEGRTSGDVAKNATLRGIETNKTQVIGVIGAGRASRGLIRLRNGKIVTVRLGDRIDGGAINSIGNGKISYVKGGRTYNLPILNGR